jgi:predicted O-methyltransferase YrrM
MFNLNLIKAYITHRINANTLHGTHSPFVYNLLKDVVYNQPPNPIYIGIEKRRTRLLKDKRIINITDLGAGSHYNNKKQKAVASLAQNALKSSHWAQLICRLAKWQNPQNILELGTCLGITSSYIRMAAPNAEFTTMEGCVETAAIASESLSVLMGGNTKVEIGNFDSLLPKYIALHNNLDFVYFDGNHRKEATLNYFEQCLKISNENSLFIFDDIHWSKGMEEAWEIIKKHPQVTVTIDLFAIGLVFFRKEQAKEHFIIRY